MLELLENPLNIMGLFMLTIFAGAGLKLWQQAREEKAKKS